jgi:alpha,alpha-trehalase
MSDYHPAISDYAVIGNGQTAALVDCGGSIDWCCWPRFDSPAVFCRLIDAKRGGNFRVAPTGTFRQCRSYVPETNILQTRFTTGSGKLLLTDLMPAPAERDGEQVFPHRILRLVECTDGQIELDIVFRPSFDYARTTPCFQEHPRGSIAYGENEALGLVSRLPLELHSQQAIGRFRVSAGHRFWLILTHGPSADADELIRFSEDDAETEYDRTLNYWRRWAGQCRYEGPYRQQVVRSALVLKLLIFQPEGGLIAAPTTSLPAEIGGERNWDYRYTWLRDSGLVLDSLQQLGYHNESMQFIDWLEKLCLGKEDELRVLYRVDGKPAPNEHVLEHLSGYRNSKPVRIGNGAAEQTQVDNYGQIVDAVLLCYKRMPRAMGPDVWRLLRKLVNRAAERWDEPDQGPWELRQPPQHHLYSKLYCWVGLDRAIRFAEQHGLPGEIDGWRTQRDAVRQEILSRGYTTSVGAFTQSFGSRHLDASALTVPLVGFLPADDDRVLSTLQRIERDLTEAGLVYRYRFDDGLPGSDSTFALCSFWLVMNYALVGLTEKARALFEHICRFANDVGLLSEQINPASRELLGNFPQGFTHLGLIRAALHLKDHGPAD